ncbi:hypothetical protein A2U01_0080108, partial [Trifolium medium]|nr:hypothetical protein [Trifolium medium]
TIVNSQGDESMKTLSTNIGDSEPFDKTVGTEAHAIDVDDLTSGKDPLRRTLPPALQKG